MQRIGPPGSESGDQDLTSDKTISMLYNQQVLRYSAKWRRKAGPLDVICGEHLPSGGR
jgi:hypothetical protein